MQPARHLLLALVPLIFGGRAVAATQEQSERPNIVLVVLDDLGVDRLRAYCSVSAEVQPPPTPTIDALAARGLVFERAFADPLCSPTRAQILTGRHGFRTGIGGLVDFSGGSIGLPLRERILPEVLAGYDSSLVGKWHLADPKIDGLQHPLSSGFGYFAGSLYNLTAPPIKLGEALCPPLGPFGYGYTHWVKARPGARGKLEESCSSTYATTDTTDEALARMSAMTAPWFLEVAYNAPHTPFEPPPRELVGGDELEFATREDANALVSDRMIEALDRELGRLLDGIRAVDPRAYVVLIADNGTDSVAAGATADGCFAGARSKGTLYQGGIRVPLIVAGPDVVPGRCDALVSATDVFATITELAGQQIGAEDSISFAPYLRGERSHQRTTVYSEVFRPNYVPGARLLFAPAAHTRAVQNERFKLLRWSSEKGQVEEQFYDLAEDPCEQHDLAPGFGPADVEGLTPVQAANLQALHAELVALGVF